MGLDITAYRKLRLVPERCKCQNADDGYCDNHTQFYDNPEFPGHINGVLVDAVYEWEEQDGFRAGSYGGYNHWRELLAQLADYPVGTDESIPGHPRPSHQVGAFQFDEGPFLELICFSDCEGTIGPVVAAKLANDFRDWEERAKEFAAKYGENGWYWIQKYQDWRKAFEMAADGGAVSFR